MNVAIERLSKLATISRHAKVFAVDAQIIRTKSLEANANERKREILVLHRDDADPLQRMLNALQPGSYIRPHRHHAPAKAETLVLLSGSIGFVTFFDDGSVDHENLVLLHPAKGALALDCRESVWHTFFALEPNTVLFEVKAGPFNPSSGDKEFAPWAPAENAPDAQSYLESLERLFTRRYRPDCGSR